MLPSGCHVQYHSAFLPCAAQPQPHGRARKLAIGRHLQVLCALPSSRRKYLIEIHAYENHLYTADFYAKVNNINRYRLRTNQRATGKLGGTVLAILADVLRQDSQACFGFIAAAMLNETSDANTKRFRMYKHMLEQKINPQRYKAITIPEQSRIFRYADAPSR